MKDAQQVDLNISKSKFFEFIKYRPHEGQKLYHNSNVRFRVPTCGRRFGKSVAAAVDREVDMFRSKDMRGWIVGPTYNLGEKEFRVMWNHLLIQLELIKDKKTKRAYNLRGGEMYIQMPWGARVEVRSATQPESLVGDELDWIIMSEAAKHKEETWQRFVRPALLDRQGSADFPSTAQGYNWYYDLWMKGQNPENKSYESWRMPSWLNTYLFPDGYEDEEIQEIKDSVTEEYFLQEIAADFSTFAGRIYNEFQVDTHCINHVFQPDWPNYIAFDWGFTNPRAVVEFQVSPNDTIYVWRESYRQYTTLVDHIEMLKNRENPDGYHLDLGFGDAADPDAVNTVSEHYIPVVAMDEAKTWRTGVELVKRFLKDYHDGISYDEQERPVLYPKYYVDHSCKEHIRELQSYRRKNQERNTSDLATSVVQKDDHTLDAMRYALMHLYELGSNASLADVMPDMQRRDHKSDIWTPRPQHNIGSPDSTLIATTVTTSKASTYFKRGMRF